MAQFRLSLQAEQDLAAILARTHEIFGEQNRCRYEALLTRAILDVAETPERLGSHARPEIAPLIRTYHLRHSRERVKPPRHRVRRPRHFLLYRIQEDDTVEIGRILHDSMDPNRHIPEAYRSDEFES